MKSTIWNKHIPTLLGIGIITIGIAITSFLVKNGVIFSTRANLTLAPQNLKIANISDASFTISYSTKEPTTGSVNFGKDKNLGATILDDRDKESESVSPHKVHYITIVNLTPETSYFFSIASGQNTFLNDNNAPFEVSTGPTIEILSSVKHSISGQVISPNGKSTDEAIVYATTENAQTISTLIKDGSYILPLNSLRTNDLSSYFAFGKNSIIKLLIVGDTLESNVSISAYQDNLPTVTLSNNYDFTVNAMPIASKSGELVGFPSVPIKNLSGSPAARTPQIILPKKDQKFSDQQPQFSGTAIPNGKVKLIIHSPENIQTEVATDANGNWKYRPTNPLSPGQHTISITTKDASGALKTITQSFIVFFSGTQVAEAATPSATPALIPTPTLPLNPTPTKTPQTTVTPNPPLLPTPTSTSSSLLTPSPTPTKIILTPTPIITIPPPGNSSILTVGILGIAITAIGLILFLLTLGI